MRSASESELSEEDASGSGKFGRFFFRFFLDGKGSSLGAKSAGSLQAGGGGLLRIVIEGFF